MKSVEEEVAEALRPAEEKMEKKEFGETKGKVVEMLETAKDASVAEGFLSEEARTLVEAGTSLDAEGHSLEQCLERARDRGNEEAGRLVVKARSLKIVAEAASKTLGNNWISSEARLQLNPNNRMLKKKVAGNGPRGLNSLGPGFVANRDSRIVTKKMGDR
jgi:hypothetical protein